MLKASGSIEKFKGFKEVYNFSEKDDEIQTLPELEKNTKLVSK